MAHRVRSSVTFALSILTASSLILHAPIPAAGLSRGMAASIRSAPTQAAAPAAPAADNCASLSGAINDYWPGNSTVAAGSKTLTLGARRTGAGNTIAPGDSLLVIQIQGADINAVDNANYGANNGTGRGYLNNANFTAGQYEYVQATNAVGASGGTLTLISTGSGGGLVNGYVNADATSSAGARRYQVVRVPRCVGGATFGGDSTLWFLNLQWDGRTGGIIALDVVGTLNMNGRAVSATWAGFGSVSPNVDMWEGTSTSYVTGGMGKGEGIAGAARAYPGGSYGRGAPGNAGGGGNATGVPGCGNLNGGGGGGNGGAGGNGGPASGLCAPSNGSMGLGGAAVAVPPGQYRMAMGGQGGGEDRTSAWQGLGGGIVAFRVDGSVTGSGSVYADGRTPDLVPVSGGILTTGNLNGGGGGGTILIAASTGISALNLYVRGGNGRNGYAHGALTHCVGSGGGGGGGKVYRSHSGPVSFVSGGTSAANSCGGSAGAN